MAGAVLESGYSRIVQAFEPPTVVGSKHPIEKETTMVNPIPEGTRTVTPHLVIKGASKAIDFYTSGRRARRARQSR